MEIANCWGLGFRPQALARGFFGAQGRWPKILYVCIYTTSRRKLQALFLASGCGFWGGRRSGSVEGGALFEGVCGWAARFGPALGVGRSRGRISRISAFRRLTRILRSLNCQ